MQKLKRPDRTNFEDRIEIYKYRTQEKPLSFYHIALKLNKTPQAIQTMWHRIKNKTLEELETQRDHYLSIDK